MGQQTKWIKVDTLVTIDSFHATNILSFELESE